MDIEKDFLHHLNNSKNISNKDDNFVMCPKIFYTNLSEVELQSMQQLYNVAYQKAVEKTTKKFDDFYDSFYDGEGI